MVIGKPWLGLFFLLLSFFPAFAERIFSEKETKLRVEPTDKNYYLATLIGEAESYAPTYYDDYIVTLDNIPVLHFTKNGSEILDYYFYIKDLDDFAFMRKFFKEHKEQLGELSDSIYFAFLNYMGTIPEFKEEGIHSKVEEIIKNTTHTTLFRVVGESPHLDKIDKTLYQYLWSNGIKSIQEIQNNSFIRNLIVNKFYMLSTTYFYRDFSYVKEFINHLEPIKKDLKEKNRPFRAKVYACSTGEEVITYAIELLESGINNFYILASDINEASLAYASRMQFPFIAFERLSLNIQQKVKKYFRLNEMLNVWELKNYDFFASRIKFVNQNILEKLPSSLEKEFAPPYDLVSIMNVLLYLEDKAVQSQKDYWADIVNKNGIMILHDAKYSVSKGALGQKYAFDNFFVVNEWVNLKNDSKFDPKEKISFYEKRFSTADEVTFLMLTNTYILNGEADNAFECCIRYLEKNPLSYSALYVGLKLNKELKKKDDSWFLNPLLQAHMYQMGSIKLLLDQKVTRAESDFIKDLFSKYQYFLVHYRNKPDEMETIFNKKNPPSEKCQVLKLLLKAMSYTLLQSSEIKLKSTDEIERLSLEGFKIIEEIYNEYPEYIVAGKFLNSLIIGLVKYYIEEKLYGKALEYTDKGIKMFETGFRNKNYYYILEGLGMLHLLKALIYQQQGHLDQAKSAVENSIFYLSETKFLLQDLPLIKHHYFYYNLGQSFFLQAKIRLKEGNLQRALADLNNALECLEYSLELNPLYGRDASKIRDQLLGFVKEKSLSLQ